MSWNNHLAFRVTASLAAAFLAAASASGATGPADGKLTIVDYDGVALSPDATRIASVDTAYPVDLSTDGHNVISIRDTKGIEAGSYDPCPDCTYHSPTWSPDGHALAFLGVDDTRSSLFRVENGKVTKIMSIDGSSRKLRWSSDGTTLAFLLTAHAHDGGHRVTTYRRVGVIDVPKDAQRIMTVAALGGEPKAISPANLWVYDFDWRSDTRGFVGMAAEGDADNQWYYAKLLDISADGRTRPIAIPTMQIARPRVSADGKKLAVIGGLMSDEGVEGGDVFVIDLLNGTTTNVTEGYKGTFNSVSWIGPKLIAGITVYASTGTASIDPATHKVTDVRVFAETISAREGRVSLSADGRSVAYASQSFTTPAHLMFGLIGSARAITQVSPSLVKDISVRDVRWQSDGRQIQGWLLLPQSKSASAPQPRPLIMDVHGGPSYAATPYYVGSRQYIAGDMLNAGYAYLVPNVRGSFGAGEEFIRSNLNDMGDGPLRDALAGVDAVERMTAIDDHRLGLFGWSYAGFFTMWAATHTQRFQAIVSGAGMADWTSYYSQTVIPAWVDLFLGGPPYGNMENYDRASPIRYLQNAKTPTLLLNGERDSGAPYEQAEAFWKGLLYYKVPTKFVLYPDEAHGFHNPVNINQRAADILDWFNKWVKG
jgi:dipeptidyl aminopeptidase/acylaminoacyl peptidase